MRRMRLMMFLAVMTVAAVGVQAVNAACPVRFTAYYEDFILNCALTEVTATECAYSCSVTKFHLV